MEAKQRFKFSAALRGLADSMGAFVIGVSPSGAGVPPRRWFPITTTTVLSPISPGVQVVDSSFCSYKLTTHPTPLIYLFSSHKTLAVTLRVFSDRQRALLSAEPLNLHARSCTIWLDTVSATRPRGSGTKQGDSYRQQLGRRANVSSGQSARLAFVVSY